MKLGDVVSGMNTFQEAQRTLGKTFADAVSPTFTDALRSAASLDSSITKALRAQQLDATKFAESIRIPTADNPHWPALPKPMMVDFTEPLRVELSEPVVPDSPPWWKQGWVLEWLAIGVAIALGVIGIAT